MIKQGAEIEARDNDGMTSLHLAAKREQKLLLIKLLEKGANINAQDNHMKTALHYTVENDFRTVCLRLLLKWCASINLQDVNGETPLHAAIRMDNFAKVILKHGKNINFNLEDNKRQTVFEIAFKNDEFKIARQIAKKACPPSNITHSIYPLQKLI